MFATAEIVAAQKDALVVPVSAVGGGDDGATALKVQDGVVHVVKIASGIRDGGSIEITRGLSQGDSVVTKAGAFVRDGDRINPVPDDAQAAASN
jgi:HlyD family secretion protein